MTSLYDRDFYKWTQKNAEHLRARNFDALDLENIAEEIESLGRKDKHQLKSRLMLLLMHMLKWQYQPDHRSASWSATINVQRKDTLKLLDESPSLKAIVPATLEEVYTDARELASIETHIWIDDFPVACPWSIDQILGAEFLPQ